MVVLGARLVSSSEGLPIAERRKPTYAEKLRQPDYACSFNNIRISLAISMGAIGDNQG
jgi:hypothetical protein